MSKRKPKGDLMDILLAEGKATIDDLRDEFGRPVNKGSSQGSREDQRNKEAMKRARKRAAEVAGYVSHLVAFVIVVGFLALLNVFLGGFPWALIVALAWGIGLAFHTWEVFGPKMDKEWQERKAQEWVAKQEGRRSGTPARSPAQAASAPAGTPSAGAPETLAGMTERASDEVDRLRRVARRIPKPDVRRQALVMLSTADQIVLALGDGAGDVRTAQTFLDSYLGPTGTILDRYQRLTTREIASATPVLRRVEEHDLPLLSRRLEELYDKLHQGDVIDLQVASEMLAFELDEPDPSGPAITESASRRDG